MRPSKITTVSSIDTHDFLFSSGSTEMEGTPTFHPALDSAILKSTESLDEEIPIQSIAIDENEGKVTNSNALESSERSPEVEMPQASSAERIPATVETVEAKDDNAENRHPFQPVPPTTDKTGGRTPKAKSIKVRLPSPTKPNPPKPKTGAAKYSSIKMDGVENEGVLAYQQMKRTQALFMVNHLIFCRYLLYTVQCVLT